MRIRRSLNTIATLLFLTSVGFGQHQTVPADIRNRKVNIAALNQVTMLDAATRVLHAAKMPGGIATKSFCGPNQTFNFVQRPLTLGDFIDAVLTMDHTYQWNIDDDVLNLTQFDGEPSLLDTAITHLGLADAQTLDDIVNAVLEHPQVEQAIAKLHLERGTPEIGLRSLERPGTTVANKKILKIEIDDASLRTVLNKIARERGNAVWHYDERRCGRTQQFSISFLVW